MSFGIKVEGGTGAGCKRALKPAQTERWHCPYGHDNPPYALRCLETGCREKRP